jgi:hypothetical protein
MTAIVDQPKAMEERPVRVQTAAEERDSRDLLALVVAYPVGARHGSAPTIRRSDRGIGATAPIAPPGDFAGATS